MAVVGTTPANLIRFPPSCSTPLTSVKFLVPRQNYQKRRASSKFAVLSAKFGFGSSEGGASVLERPTLDPSLFVPDAATQIQEGGDIGHVRDKKGVGSGDSFRVLLIDDVRHNEKLVVKVLPHVVPSVTPDDAKKLFLESRKRGAAVVIVTVKEHAEFYSQMMVRGGLRSTIEPDSTTA